MDQLTNPDKRLKQVCDNKRKYRKSILAISNANIDTNRMDLRSKSSSNINFRNQFKTGSIKYEPTKYLTSTLSPSKIKHSERMKKIKKEANQNLRKSRTASIKLEPASYASNINAISMDSIPFNPIQKTEVKEEVTDDILYEIAESNEEQSTPKVSISEYWTPDSSKIAFCNEINDKENISYQDETPNENTAKNTDQEVKEEATDDRDFLYEIEESNEEQHSKNVNLTNDKENTSDQENIISENENRANLIQNIDQEIEQYIEKLQGVVGAQIYIQRKIPNVRNMLKDKDNLNLNDCLVKWDALVASMDNTIGRHNASLHNIREDSTEDGI